MVELFHLRTSPLNSWCCSWILFMQMFVAPDIKEGKDPGRSWLFSANVSCWWYIWWSLNRGSFRLISGWRDWTFITLIMLSYWLWWITLRHVQIVGIYFTRVTEDWVVEDADFAFDMIPIADRFSVQILERHRHEPMCMSWRNQTYVCVMTMNSTLHHTLTYELYFMFELKW